MKMIFRLAVIGLCLFSLFGCGKKDRFILDGPGMVNEGVWESFTLSQSASISYDCFTFTVDDSGVQPLLTGYCQDQEGNTYEAEETPIVLTEETMAKLRALKLEALPDVSHDNDNGLSDDVFILDATTYSLHLTYVTKQQVEKGLDSSLVKEIYDILCPCFVNEN